MAHFPFELKTCTISYFEHLCSFCNHLIDHSGVSILTKAGRIIIDISDVDTDDGCVAEWR